MPVFVSVMVLGPDVVATGWFPNGMLPGETLALGSTPVPVKLADCPASVSVPFRVPKPPGVKVTSTEHVLFAVTTPPQPVALKSPDASGPVGCGRSVAVGVVRDGLGLGNGRRSDQLIRESARPGERELIRNALAAQADLLLRVRAVVVGDGQIAGSGPLELGVNVTSTVQVSF